MQSNSLLTVDGLAIPVPQAFAYLQAGGKLQEFVTAILRQHIIAQQFQTRDDLTVDPFVIEQALVNFRVERQLTDPVAFEEWLEKNKPAYASFRNQTVYRVKLERLKALVTESKLQEHFIERKIFLDQVVLSQIAVAEQELAEELLSQLLEGSASFEQLAREYSLTEDRIANGMMGPLSRGRLKLSLRAAIDAASPGEVVGPIEVGGRYCLFRVEQFLPAQLEGKIKEQLQNEIFEQWLAEKAKQMNVQLEGH